MIEKTYKCKACGFLFKLSLLERELQAGGIPCPGCGETDLEETNEEADISVMSRGAECSGHCQCCPSREDCSGAEINNQK